MILHYNCRLIETFIEVFFSVPFLVYINVDVEVKIIIIKNITANIFWKEKDSLITKNTFYQKAKSSNNRKQLQNIIMRG